MKIHRVEQGSHSWHQLRLGIPTASRFDELITPARLEPSSQAKKYRAQLVAEWLLGQPLDVYQNQWMERGTELEPDARRWYAFQHDVDVEVVGFVTRDDGLVGGSPDGLVGDDGGLEIKTPSAATHVQYLLGAKEMHHRGQCQGLLYLTGRPWWDLVSYHPDLPPKVKRVERDEEYIEALVPALDVFLEALEADKEKLAEHKVSRPWHPEIQDELRQSEREAAGV